MKIVVAIDGSSYSQAVIEECASRLWPPGSEMRLVHVAGPSENDLVAGLFSMFEFANDKADSVSTEEAALENIALALASRIPGVAVKSERLLGEPVKALLGYAQAFKANLIVTGTRDSGIWEGFFLGSVSQGLLEQADCPVLVARNFVRPTEASRPKQVLICIDDSVCSGAAVEWLMGQSWLKGCRVCFTSVAEPRPAPGLTSDSQSEATQLLTWQAERVFAENLAHEWAVLLQEECLIKEVYSGVVEGDPAEAIVKVAKNWPADLVLVGSHGKSALAKLVLGSVSQKVSRRVQCSVVVVKGISSRRYREIRAKVTSDHVLSAILSEQTNANRRRDSSRGENTIHVMPTSLRM
ncbi:hypothetical protein BH11CYA1_BH11CYA1_08340 [soil metagenome]